jgi:hypothetical protein
VLSVMLKSAATDIVYHTSVDLCCHHHRSALVSGATIQCQFSRCVVEDFFLSSESLAQF